MFTTKNIIGIEERREVNHDVGMQNALKFKSMDVRTHTVNKNKKGVTLFYFKAI